MCTCQSQITDAIVIRSDFVRALICHEITHKYAWGDSLHLQLYMLAWLLCTDTDIKGSTYINKPSDCHYLKTDVPDSLECKIMNNFRVIVSPSTREQQVFNHSKVAINIECGACLEKKRTIATKSVPI